VTKHLTICERLYIMSDEALPYLRPTLVVCIGEYISGAGQSRVAFSEINALRDKYNITLVSPRITSEVPAGVEVKKISLKSPKGVFQIWNLVRSADAVHLHDSLGYMTIATLAGKTKCVATCHGIAPPSIRKGMWQKVKGYITLVTYPILYRRMTTVVTFSAFLNTWLHERSVRESVVVTHGAPDDIVVPREVPRALRLVYIGEVSYRKGIDLLLDGMVACPDEVTLDIVGVGDMEWLSRNISKRRLAKRVRIHGRISDSAMFALLDKSLALVSFSRWEGFGLPIVEGFSRGRPAIVLGGSAMEEVVGNAGAGIVLDGPAHLPAAVVQVAEQWATLSELALKVAEDLNWEEVWQSYDKVFQGVICQQKN